MIAPVGDHKIVQYAAVFIGKKGIALPAFTEAENADWNQRFQRRLRIFKPPGSGNQKHLPHVAHVEKPRGLARV